MNSDPKKSAQPCGCDEGANYVCKQHRTHVVRALEDAKQVIAHLSPFSNDAKIRKNYPVFTGVMMYFPHAIAAVAQVSKVGNDQHNPGEPLHWAREKSTDQLDTATRHIVDHGVGNTKDTDGCYQLAKAAWRILAELQLTIEKERGL